MSSLTSEELSLLRKEAQIWYVDLCDVLRFTAADDAYGGRGDSTPDPVATGVKCSVESGAGHEQTVALIGALQTEAEYIITLPAELDIRVDDQLVITTKGNLTLRVQAVLAPESNEIDRMVIANKLLGV